jgi:hypothetical protein
MADVNLSPIETMERIKGKMPSWKAEVHLARMCYEEGRHWCASGTDLWGHCHTPTFWSADPAKALAALELFVDRAVSEGEDARDLAFIDDEGNEVGCYADVYLDDPGRSPVYHA